MQRKKRAITIIASSLMIVMLGIIISVATTINGKSFTTNGGDYYKKFGKGHMSDRDFYNVSYKQYAKYYFGSDVKNDYKAYVQNTPDAYCLNETTGTGTAAFYVANIIDIVGNKVTFAKSGKTITAKTDAQKKAVAGLAYALYARSNGVGNNTSWRQWMDVNGGWKNFYNTFKNEIDDASLKGNVGSATAKTTNADYEKLIKNLKEIKNFKDTKPKTETGSYTVNGKTYQTKIGPYHLQLNSGKGVTTTVTGKVDGKTYTGVVEKAKDGYYYLYFSEKLASSNSSIVQQLTNKTITDLTITQKYEAIKARMVLLGTGLNQARGIGRGKKQVVTEQLKLDNPSNTPVTPGNNVTPNTIIPNVTPDIPVVPTPSNETVDVSLQKYIVEVNGKGLTNNESKVTDRKNTYSATDEAQPNAKKVVSKSEEANMKTGTYKKSNVVAIEAGDTVTYRIHVYNNSDVDATTVKVKDQLLYYNGKQYGKYEIQSVKHEGQDVTSQWKKTSALGLDQYEYIINNLPAHGETYLDVTVKFNTYLPNEQVIDNMAWIAGTNPVNKTTYRTVDKDYVKMKPYAVSLEKFVSAVNGKTVDKENVAIAREGKAEHKYDNDKATTDKTKYNNVVVVEKGDYVTYTIKVTNDSKETAVKISKIKDTLPEGIEGYIVGDYAEGAKVTARPNNGAIELTNTASTLLQPGESTTCKVTVKVSEENISVDILKNTAVITEMKNKNDVVVTDTTENDNEDADYIELRDIKIEGLVWNDITFDKTAKQYNALYDTEGDKKEKTIEGIDVFLYRGGKTLVAQTKTDANGKYSFSKESLATLVKNENERFIKGPRTANTNRWSGEYYAYCVVFKYDGITYTTTPDGTSYVKVDTSLPENYQIDSNAAEDNKDGRLSEETRVQFNTRFSKINNESGIEYTTENEKGYIPQSHHIYNPKTMAREASTNLIQLSNNGDLEKQLLYVNVGLRGRELFDLELKSEVDYTKMTINGQTGTYDYKGSNKVKIRTSDLAGGQVEDMANVATEKQENALAEVDQDVRRTDLDIDTANDTAKKITTQKTVTPYGDPKMAIKVVYRVDITNASDTDGTATRIIDYYDSRYTFLGAYANKDDIEKNNSPLKASAGESGTDFKSVIIDTQGTNLSQGQKMSVYIAYQLNEPLKTLHKLITKEMDKIPTYNMAEVYEYTSKAAQGQSEYIRGLLDKDSAPGSANQEQVRLTSTEGQGTATKGGNPTTVQYYFLRNNGTTAVNDLTKLKYEDDTYATPTLYFRIDETYRIANGTVFEDITKMYDNYIKSGNGIQDKSEKGIYGVTVELVELNEKANPENIGLVGDVRYSTVTNKEGAYTFRDFLPGNYVVRYHYGDTTRTVLLNQGGSKVNATSFNGEDYQSTNNTGKLANKADANIKALQSPADTHWYIYNENNKFSTATDNVARRETVARKVTGYTDAEMKVLDRARKGTQTENDNINKLISDTNMFATTPNFNVAVEKPDQDGETKTKEHTKFDNYELNEINCGLAAVPKSTITLQKEITGFTVKDAAGENTLANWTKGNDNAQVGNILNMQKPDGSFDGHDVSIEDDKLQGARLAVTFAMHTNVVIQKNFDGSANTAATITGVTDFIDNDLSYNPDLTVTDENGKTHKNSEYWKVVSYQESQTALDKVVGETVAYIGDSAVTGNYGKEDADKIVNKYGNGSKTEYTSLDKKGTKYTTIVEATANNPIFNRTSNGATDQWKKGEKSSSSITLEKTLSSDGTTIGDIITSSINTYEYDNHVEITNLAYDNTKTEKTGNNFVFRDRILRSAADNAYDYWNPETKDDTSYILLAGVQHDSVASDRITIHPPTGGDQSNTYYYVAAGALAIIATGAVCIKKFAFKKD